MIELERYQTRKGRQPVSDWIAALDDPIAARVLSHVQRLSVGTFVNTRPVGSGLFELRMDFGPGYRLYYAWRNDGRIILLCGGDKGSQARDIKRARAFAADLRERE